MSDPFHTTYRQLSQEEIGAIGRIKTRAAELFHVIDGLEQGREIGLAKTKLEEAVMWAAKSITK